MANPRTRDSVMAVLLKVLVHQSKPSTAPRNWLAKQICVSPQGFTPDLPTQNLCGWSPGIWTVTSSAGEPYTCWGLGVPGLWNPRGQLLSLSDKPILHISIVWAMSNDFCSLVHHHKMQIDNLNQGLFSNVGGFTILVWILKCILNRFIWTD